jgi:hypothetical protein
MASYWDDKRVYFKTAKLKGVERVFVGLHDCRIDDKDEAIFLCSMPFGPCRWIVEAELENFVL